MVIITSCTEKTQAIQVGADTAEGVLENIEKRMADNNLFVEFFFRGMRIMLDIVIGAVILLISEAMPMAATCFIIVVAMKYTGVMSLKAIQQSACSSAVFFCMAGFGIGAALQNTNLAAILLKFLYTLGKGDARKMISAVCWLSAIISVFVSDGAAQIVVLAVVTGVVRAFGDPEPGTSRLAGGMMLAITIGAMTGGLMLPCSNSVNVAIMDLSEVVAGIPMTFFQWAIFGIPCSIIMTAFAAWLIPRYFKPEPLTKKQKEDVQELFGAIPNHLEARDQWYLAITAVMVVVTMLCIFPLATGMSTTGAGEWVVGMIFAGSAGWNLMVIFVMGTIAAFLVHCLVPQGSANGALSAAVIAPVIVGDDPVCDPDSAAVHFVFEDWVGCIGKDLHKNIALLTDRLYNIFVATYGYQKKERFSDACSFPLSIFENKPVPAITG